MGFPIIVVSCTNAARGAYFPPYVIKEIRQIEIEVLCKLSTTSFRAPNILAPSIVLRKVKFYEFNYESSSACATLCTMF
jgi:hypothetical protein